MWGKSLLFTPVLVSGNHKTEITVIHPYMPKGSNFYRMNKGDLFGSYYFGGSTYKISTKFEDEMLYFLREGHLYF